MNEIANTLLRKKCTPCEGGVAPLAPEQVTPLLRGLPGWAAGEKRIFREYRFGNHFEAMAFVNAIAWISHREDHHPRVITGYDSVRVEYWTHAINGLSENDFICAAKVDALFEL